MSGNANLQANPNANTVAQSAMSQPTPTAPGGSMLLNQTLSAIPPSANQPKNPVFIANTAGNANLTATPTTNSGMQITLNPSQNTGIGLPSTSNFPAMGQQQIMQQQNVPNQQVMAQQQMNMQQANSSQVNMPANVPAGINASAGRGGGGGGGGNGFGQNDREQNLMTIEQLEQTLKEAQKREMEFQQQFQIVPSVDGPKSGQIANAAMQPQQNNAVRQHLQHQLQQKQMIHLQQQQQQQVNINQQNLQLRHLLQQQQMRTLNPSRMQATVPGVTHQQPQQQILLQGNQIPQQQQFRFQTPIQAQQQQPAQPGQANAGQQQHNRAFFDESPLY